MAFSTKRGRPASNSPERSDLGTPELIKKRLLGITAEPIDICLSKDLITPDQHWCGIHLRWLYTLRYGVPSVKALDPTHLGGRETGNDTPEWRKEREREYHLAVEALQNPPTVQAVLKLCVFNQRPSFLQSSHASILVRERELELVRTGLGALTNTWCRRPGAQKGSAAAPENPSARAR